VNEEWTGRNPEEIRKKSGRNPVVRQLETAGLISWEGTCMSADKENVFFYSFLQEQTHSLWGRDTISLFDQRLCSWHRFFSPGHLDISQKRLFLNDDFLIFTTRLLETCYSEVDHYIFYRKNNCDLMSVVHRRLPENGSYARKESWWLRFSLNGDCLSTLTKLQDVRWLEAEELYRNC
jgi:hypothetical protein